ncbi:putative MSHA biogenesis protein MshO [Sterolibacterium denitrificans]|uniref:MSHA biogenesis protein MshO n=1 Tax=Sterolibacterium denitrificans TaxID=157592 RepID=A0A7Z7HQ64_9PROT|nr:prepilin-type N-terminal cleavage/methylation domain-containing protein [Sterolibacterium denitrificans]SMB24367.1 putative MSHA biogenesis protein MshO [Sterolibacterium denitrificans]
MMTPLRQSFRRSRSSGFSLVEMIMVIVITGIIAGMVAVFMSGPLMSYVSASQRADLTDTADLALRRLSREIRQALPNSLRVTTADGNYWIEFIATRGGGSYLPSAGLFSAGAFNLTVSSQMPSNPAIAANDYIVINNTGNGDQSAYGCSGLAYCNTMNVTGIAGQQLALTPLNGGPAFAWPGPSTTRFQVVPAGTRAVAYSCPVGTAGPLRRYSNYGLNGTQAAAIAAAKASGGNLVANNARCNVVYPPSLQSFGVLVVTLTLTDRAGDESVTLMREIHIDNAL